MAKRKRLEVPIPSDLETKTATSLPRARMPIADVAGDTAGRAALEEVAREMTAAEQEGRVVKKIPLTQIAVDHLSRDRMVLDPDEMASLVASIADRGQQTPIEVLRLSGGQFGLISGLRRLEALRSLGALEVLALIKAPGGARGEYKAMVEENEIRASLSFYERANIAVAAVGQGVYPNARAAVKELFAHAPKAKRSKITKFVTICEVLGASLRFPTAIPEHLGLKLASVIEAGQARGIVAALKAANPQDAVSERQVLERVLKAPTAPQAERIELRAGLRLETKEGRAVLSGHAIDAAFLAALKKWAKKPH